MTRAGICCAPLSSTAASEAPGHIVLVLDSRVTDESVQSDRYPAPCTAWTDEDLFPAMQSTAVDSFEVTSSLHGINGTRINAQATNTFTAFQPSYFFLLNEADEHLVMSYEWIVVF